MNTPDEEFEHESYCMIGFNRVTGGIGELFGSPISHNSAIVMRLYQAKQIRHLSADWYHAKSATPMIEVMLSPGQFSELLTTMNVGSGVPATIISIDGTSLEKPPVRNVRRQFNEEFKASVNDIEDRDAQRERARRIILNHKKAMTKEERDLVHNVLCFDSNLKSNLKFVYKMFDEACEKVVVHAKADIDATYSGIVNKLGGEELSKKISNNSLAPNKMIALENIDE